MVAVRKNHIGELFVLMKQNGVISIIFDSNTNSVKIKYKNNSEGKEKMLNYSNEAQKGNYYIIVDHLRTTIFALADGAAFEPKGRGYILKKLVKKASLLAYLIGLDSKQLQKISEKLILVNSAYY